jgi:hypothetical protein
VTTIELTRAVVRRLKKFRYLIFLFGVACSAILVMYARQSPVLYTASAKVFPLNSPQDANSSNSLLSQLGLGGEGSKSFSDDASINIVALANSRSIREAVASKKISSMGNKTIAQLMMLHVNDQKGWFDKDVEYISDTSRLNIWAAAVLKDGLAAQIDKTGILNISFTSKSTEIVQVITETFIEMISQFYIDLRREKAKRDYTFAAAKVDSLYRIMRRKDAHLVMMDKTTLFTDKSRLEFQVPMDNQLTEKALIRHQYTQAVTNRENSAYRLQKATPVIKVLDRPAAPFDEKRKSPLVFGTIGFIVGVISMIFFVVFGLFYRYINEETNKAIFGKPVVPAATMTAA